MVALLGVRDAAPGKKGSPQERRPVAGLLHHTEIDVEHQILLGIKPQQIDDMVQLFLICDLEDPLALLLLRLRLAVELQVEGPAEQFGEPGGKMGVLRDDADLRGTEGIAKQQNSVGLRPGTAQLLYRQAA